MWNQLELCFHIDITEIYPNLDEARNEALKRNEVLALYNFKHNQTVYLHTERAGSEDQYLLEQL